MRQNEPVGQEYCSAGSCDLAAMRRSPLGGEYAIYGNRGVPEFRMRARVACLRTRAKRVRRSVHNLMQAYWHSLPRASCARARQFGCWQTPLALAPLHPLRRCRTTRILAHTLGIPLNPYASSAGARTAAYLLNTAVLPLGPRPTLRAGQKPLRRSDTPPATAQPGRQLRRRPSRCVETMRIVPGCCERNRTTHSGQLPLSDCDALPCSG